MSRRIRYGICLFCLTVFLAGAAKVYAAAAAGEYPESIAETSEETGIPQEEQDLCSVSFSKDSGIYRESRLAVTLSNPGEYPVYYTTDGSVPDENSEKAEGEIIITDADANSAFLESLNAETLYDEVVKQSTELPTATVIRAAALLPDGTFGPVATNTYILNNDIKNFNCAVVSLVADPYDLLDYNTGIMAKGAVYDANKEYNESLDKDKDSRYIRANFCEKGKEWERAANLELFDSSNELSYENGCGIRIKGSWSRRFAQKSFNVYFREDYGEKSMKYALFGDENKDTDGNTIEEYKNISIRAGGNDTEFMKFRDPLFQEVVSGKLDFSTQAAKPAILFLNGEYFGAYALNEKYSEHYVESHYGVDKDNVMIIEEGELDEGEESDIQYYEELMSYSEKDLTDPAVWESFCNIADIDSMTDYFAAGIYLGLGDWGDEQNCRLWRVRTPEKDNEYGDGRWRWMLYDTEYCAGFYLAEKTQPECDSFERAKENFLLFASVMKNEEFAALIKEKISEVSALYSYEVMEPLIDEYAREWTGWVMDTALRFKDETEWAVYADIKWMKDFFEKRNDYIEGFFEK